MKLTKGFLALFLSVSVLSACNQEDKTNHDSEVTSSEKKAVKKHQAVNLPIAVFKSSHHGIEGYTFVRSITHIEFKDFDESSEIEFLDRYDDAVRRQNYDYQKDFKLLVITMKHEMKGDKPSLFEGYEFAPGTGLVIGDDYLANKNKFLMYQQEYVTERSRVGATSDETGTILFAVPNKYAKDKNLQLRIVQKLDKESNYLYIDLN